MAARGSASGSVAGASSVAGSDAGAGAGDGGDANQMRVIKRIVAAQDAFISDLERKNKQLVELVKQGRAREVEFKAAEAAAAKARESADRWRAQCQARDAAARAAEERAASAANEAASLRKRLHDHSSASNSRTASVQAAEGRFKAAQASWAKERESLVGLVEKTNAMAQSLESELRKVKAAAHADRHALEAKVRFMPACSQHRSVPRIVHVAVAPRCRADCDRRVPCRCARVSVCRRSWQSARLGVKKAPSRWCGTTATRWLVYSAT